MVNKEYLESELFQFDYSLQANKNIQEKIFDICKYELLKETSGYSLGFLYLYHTLFHNVIDDIGNIDRIIQHQISNRMMFDYYKQ